MANIIYSLVNMNLQSFTCIVPDEASMLTLGERLVPYLQPPQLVFLHGELGVGKTTLVRGILRVLGWQGIVKSPTFTVVEPYELDDKLFYHLDLYRLTSADELEFIGIRDYFTPKSLIFVEWPSRALACFPEPDVHCYIDMLAHGRELRWLVKS